MALKYHVNSIYFLRHHHHRQQDQTIYAWALPSDLNEKHRLYAHYHHHDKPFFHPTLPVKIELHRRILVDMTDDAQLCETMKAQPFNFVEDAIVLIPDLATRAIHNLLHAQIADKQRLKKVLDLRQLLEFAALVHYYATELDADSLLNRLRAKRQPILAEYWAQAERWLKVSYPDSLPRSSYETINLWLLKQVATQPLWLRLYRFVDGLRKLPKLLPRLIMRVWLMPGYFPAKIKEILKGQSY